MHVQNTEVERLRMWGTSMTCGCVTEEGVSGKKEHSMQYRSVEKRKRSRVYIDWQCSGYDIYTYVGMVQLMKGAWRNWG